MPSWRHHKDGGHGVATSTASREVGAQIDVEVTAPTTLEFQVAVAHQPGLEVRESLAITFNGNPLQPLEIIGPHDTRIHSVDVGEGAVSLSYSATVSGEAQPAPVREIDLVTYLRPSRYAESDKFFGFAATEFGRYADSATVLERVSSWVGTRLDYVPGSSDPIDGAAGRVPADATAWAYRDARWAMIADGNNSGRELFDLRKDPGERTNIARDHLPLLDQIYKRVLRSARLTRLPYFGRE